MFDYNAAMAALENRRRTMPTLSYLEKQVGGLSKPSKIPWYGWSIAARHCITGSVLRPIENSVCSNCYACKGRYQLDNVQLALERRLGLYQRSPAIWAADMAALLEAKARGERQHFRWFDSGDLQTTEMAEAMLWIAQQVPRVKFWLPTREVRIVTDTRIIQLVNATENTCVRVSAPMLGSTNPCAGYPTSSVGAVFAGFNCPAYKNDGKCGDCRACWFSNIPNVNYPLH